MSFEVPQDEDEKADKQTKQTLAEIGPTEKTIAFFSSLHHSTILYLHTCQSTAASSSSERRVRCRRRMLSISPLGIH
eukprot:1080919-Amphidinium_carterae.1